MLVVFGMKHARYIMSPQLQMMFGKRKNIKKQKRQQQVDISVAKRGCGSLH